jgi:hypothetical protein
MAMIIGRHGNAFKVDAAMLKRDSDVKFVGEGSRKPLIGANPAKPPGSADDASAFNSLRPAGC